MRTDIFDKKDEILQLISNNESKASIARLLGCKIQTLDSYLKKMNIDYKGNQGAKGKKTDPSRLSAIELSRTKWVGSHKLKLRLIEDGLKEHKCEICGITEWMGKPVPIELDHIDGDHYNNDIDNLRIVCPNCHAQTDTHAGKNTKRNADVA